MKYRVRTLAQTLGLAEAILKFKLRERQIRQEGEYVDLDDATFYSLANSQQGGHTDHLQNETSLSDITEPPSTNNHRTQSSNTAISSASEETSRVFVPYHPPRLSDPCFDLSDDAHLICKLGYKVNAIAAPMHKAPEHTLSGRHTNTHTENLNNNKSQEIPLYPDVQNNG